MIKERFSFISHMPVPEDQWERFAASKVEDEDYILTAPKENAYYGRELYPSGSLIRVWHRIGLGWQECPPILVLEWVEFVHKDALDPSADTADGSGCSLFAKAIFYGELCWLNLNLALYDFELLS